MDACTLWNIAACFQIGGLLLWTMLDTLFAKDIQQSVRNFGMWSFWGGLAGVFIIGIFTDAPMAC